MKKNTFIKIILLCITGIWSLSTYAYIDLQSALTAQYHSTRAATPIDVNLVLEYFEQETDFEPIEGIFESIDQYHNIKAIVHNKIDNIWAFVWIGDNGTFIHFPYITKIGNLYYFNANSCKTQIKYNEKYIEYIWDGRTDTYRRLTPMLEHSQGQIEQTPNVDQPANQGDKSNSIQGQVKPALTK